MRLFSTFDDFCRTTLASVPGVFGKLDYLAGLRDEDGRYQHWGLARVYKEEAAQQAMAQAQRAAFLELLRMPLREVLKDLPQASRAREKGLCPFLEDVKEKSRQYIPPDLGGGSERHFSSVVDSLLALLKRSRARAPNSPGA